MARARNIKPSFFQNEELGELSPIERLFFIGLWTVADYKGCVELRPKRLKVQILPYDDCDIEKIVINLDKSGVIRNYSVQGVRYIKIINFERHQNPHKNEREAGSDIPDISTESLCCNGNGSIEINPEQDGTDPADSLFPITDSPFPIAETPNKEKRQTATRLPTDWQPDQEYLAFCRTARPDLDPHKVADSFRDYWISAPGTKGKKQDWMATWRNWVRNQRQERPQTLNFMDDRKNTLDQLTGRNKHGQRTEIDITAESSRVAGFLD